MQKTRKQDFLIALVQSLSASEVRYFKLYASIQPGEKKYLELFDLLEKGANETGELCKTLKVTATNLAVLKHYLHQILMRCLRNYEEQSSHITLINNGKEEARLLLNRRMLEHALSVTEKTLTKAWELEVFEAIDDLLDIKTQCLHGLRQLDGTEEVFAAHQKLNIIRNEIIDMNRVIAKAVHLENARSSHAELKKLLNHPLLIKQPDALKSLRTKARWYDIQFNIHCVDNPEKALQIARQEYLCYQKENKIKQVNAIAYVVNMTRIVNGETETGNFAEALTFSHRTTEALNDHELELPQARRDSIMAFTKFFRVYILLRMQDFKGAARQSEEIEEQMQTRPENELYCFVFYYAIALLHLGKSDLAADKANLLLQLNTKARMDLQAYARLVHLMAQYQLGNYQLIPYLVKSAKAWMKRNRQSIPGSDLFFKHILSAGKPTPGVRKEALRQLRYLVEQGKLAEIDGTVFLKLWLSKNGVAVE